jgi:hypothetical protein
MGERRGAMLEVIGTAYRRDDFSPEVFLDNRLTVHAPVAQQAPGLRGHVVSEVDRKLRETFEADAVVEQRFDSEVALRRRRSRRRSPRPGPTSPTPRRPPAASGWCAST